MSREARWLALFLLLGLTWRGVRYALCFPIWQDEAYLGVSILRYDYAALWREPLAYLQIAPLGFLWLQRFVVEHLGGGEYAIRLAPFVVGCATLLLFARLAWEQLGPRAAALAVGFFAASYVLVRHTVEAKQYATDAFLATLLLYVAARWQVSAGAWRLGGVAACICAVGVWVSFPLIFIAGGVSLALLPAVVRRRRASEWGAWAAFTALYVVSFAVFYVAFAADQSARAAATWLEAYWGESFPPRDSVPAFLWWLLDVHAGKMLAYPLGGGHFASSGTLLLGIAGGVALVRTGRVAFLGLLLAPVLPALIAAILHKYPYGGSARVTIYLAPAICLLCGAGVDWLLSLRERYAPRSRAFVGVCVLLLLVPVVGAVVDLVAPYKEPQYAAARAALREVATYISPTDAVAVANVEHNRDPVGEKEFHPTLRYYFVLYTHVWPHYCAGQPPPADTRWMLTFYGADFGPQRARLAELLAPVGLRAVLHSDYQMSPHNDWRLGVYRCVAAPAASQVGD